MLDTRNRAERYRDLAEECRRLAASASSNQMKNRYLLMAQDHTWLADLTMTGRFPPPWQIVEIPQGFAVDDANGQQLAVFYGLAEPNTARQTDFLTIDEARQMAVDFANLPVVTGLRLAEVPMTVPNFTSFEPDEWMRAALLPRPSDPLSNRTKFLIAIAVAALPAGYFIFMNFDRPVDVAVVPQATTEIPPVESSSAREAEALSSKATGITIEGGAKPEVQTAPLPVPSDIKPTEGDIQAGPPQMLPERESQSFAESRDDSTCLPSASAVRENHPGAWPSWTLRAPGHENTRCWYAATRTKAEAGARSARAGAVTVESQAEPEGQTTSLQPTVRSDTKLTERGGEPRLPQTLPERGKQLLATNGRDSTCFPSASAVRENSPGAWPSWTLRAPGQEGTRCWYPAKRTTANDHP
jgi:hypothetical protein